MNILVEHYKRFGKVPSLEFKKQLEPPIPGDILKSSFKLPPKKALDFLKKKGKNIITTETWNSIEARAHAQAFTVAGIMNADIVQEVFDYVQRAKSEGWSFRTFQKNVASGGLMKRMQDAGWTGKSASRLKVIYDTNMKIAAAKGKFEGMKLISDIKPYWVYKQVERNTKRHNHSLFHNKKFRHDDPIWATIFPPSAFGCACYVTATAESSGVENGADYTDRLKDSKDYNLKPLNQFEPDMNKYSVKIRQQLEKLLGGKKKKEQEIEHNNSLPDCDWADVEVATYSEGKKKCIGKLPGQKTWKDYGRPDIKDIPDKYKQETPERLKAGKTEEEAMSILTKALGLDKEGKRVVKSPIEEILLDYDTLKHIVEKRDNKRERFVNYIIPTITHPLDVWKVEYEDGSNRNSYIGLFKAKTNLLCIVRVNNDKSILWNVIPMADQYLNKHRIGELLYGLEIKK